MLDVSILSRNRNGKTAIDLVSASVKSKLSSPLEKIQCKRPSYNELPIAPPPPRRRGRTTSSTNILFFTGFDRTRKESLMKSVQTLFGRKCAATAKYVENNGSIDEDFLSNNEHSSFSLQSLISLLVVKSIESPFEQSIIYAELF